MHMDLEIAPLSCLYFWIALAERFHIEKVYKQKIDLLEKEVKV